MLNQTPIYRVSMALKNRDKRAGIDLKELVEDLAGAKDEYNAINDDGHLMLLLEPTSKRLNLLFKPGQNQEFEASMLADFEAVLRDEFDWLVYCGQDNALLEKKIARPLQQNEYAGILEELEQSSNYRLFTEPLIETLLKKRAKTGGRGSRGGYRRGDDEVQPDLSLEEALQQMDTLVGLDSFKTEMKKVVRYISNLNPADSLIPAREIYPYHYIITTDGQGVGLSTALKYMAIIFYHLGICPVYGLLEEKVEKRGRFGMHYIHSHDFDENGVCAITGVELLDEDSKQEIVGELLDEHRERVIVMVIQKDQEETINELRGKLNKLNQPYRHLHLPAYNAEELTEIFKRLLAAYKCGLDPEGEKLLVKIICQLQKQSSFCGVSTLREIAGKMIFDLKSCEVQNKKAAEKSAVNGFLLSILENSDNPAATAVNKENPLDELDNMIGLKSVKDRMREILGHFIMEKKKAEIGMDTSSLCMHMIFTGNPGTGKTTVARIIGRMLKEEGLLEKGELIEVCREDLVARYVGHTALKTAAVIEKSLGSILFIDEAYSLSGGHEHDFGHEVLATLVKKMEEHKDELVVILAGYSEEMEKMVALNPGLSSRVPHQINFPDYSAEELYQIFKQHLGHGYRLDKEAAGLLKELLSKAPSVPERQGGNGRFVRNVIERLKMKQSKRLLGYKIINSRVLQIITANDVRALLDEPDLVSTRETKQRIGF
jgi:Cdc6-like AAA superfamily ATPase